MTTLAEAERLEAAEEQARIALDAAAAENKQNPGEETYAKYEKARVDWIDAHYAVLYAQLRL